MNGANGTDGVDMRNETLISTSFVLAVAGIWIFSLGFHSVDLATHFYYMNCIEASERSVIFDSLPIDNMYMEGLGFLFIGLVAFSGGFLLFGYWSGKIKYEKI